MAKKTEKIDRAVTLDPVVFNTETKEILRSTIHFAEYNPRTIDEEGKRQIARSIRNFGIVGGILVNGRTNTVISGHQRIAELDRKFGYPEKDYLLKAEVGDWDEKEEIELNILLNNPNVGGRWSFDKLRLLVPKIDFKDAGLTEADLNMIGVDFNFQSPGEADLAAQFESLMSPVDEERRAAAERRRAEREAANPDPEIELSAEEQAEAEEAERQARIAHMKQVKSDVRDKAIGDAQDMDAYVMLSFDTFKAKAAFMERFGYDPYMKFLKGEVFDNLVERVD